MLRARRERNAHSACVRVSFDLECECVVCVGRVRRRDGRLRDEEKEGVE